MNKRAEPLRLPTYWRFDLGTLVAAMPIQATRPRSVPARSALRERGQDRQDHQRSGKGRATHAHEGRGTGGIGQAVNELLATLDNETGVNALHLEPVASLRAVHGQRLINLGAGAAANGRRVVVIVLAINETDSVDLKEASLWNVKLILHQRDLAAKPIV